MAIKKFANTVMRNDPCAYCGKPRGGTLDHIVPKARNGPTTTWKNLTGACRECNNKKKAKPLLLFLLELSGVEVDWKLHNMLTHNVPESVLRQHYPERFKDEGQRDKLQGSSCEI